MGVRLTCEKLLLLCQKYGFGDADGLGGEGRGRGRVSYKNWIPSV